ncbi:hypothetical protein FLJ01_01925 [Streptococcus agalactiae]
MSKQYDYIVIGGGSAGSGTANRAAMYYVAENCDCKHFVIEYRYQ